MMDPSFAARDTYLRPATKEDSAMLLAWRNDPDTRAASRHTDPVEPSEHAAWLERTLADPRTDLYIYVEAGHAVGTCRAEHQEYEPSEISWTVAPNWRRRGVGVRMVKALMTKLGVPRGGAFAVIKSTNIASLKIAERAGVEIQLLPLDYRYLVRGRSS